MNDVPKLLVEWSSPWEEFITAIRPALRRSPKRLAGEARSGLFPYRGMLFSWVVEAALLILVIVLPAQLTSMSPYTPPPSPKYDIIYFSGDELPSEKWPNQMLLERTLKNLRDGDIVMAHLGIWSRKDPWAPAVLEPLISGLEKKGFCFATLRDNPEYLPGQADKLHRRGLNGKG